MSENARSHTYISNRTKRVNTLSDVWAEPKINGDVFHTKGNTSVADGGGGKYIYHSTGRSAIANGGTGDVGFTIPGTDGGLDDYVELDDKTIANVLQFGAVADGVAPVLGTLATGTDNTDAFQAASDAVGGNGVFKSLYIPPGKYIVDNLTLQAGARMFGHGKEKSILYGAGGGTGSFLKDDGSNAAKITLEHLGFFMNGETGYDAIIDFGNDGAIQWGTGAFIHDCNIRDAESGIAVKINQNISKISNCWINNCEAGIEAIGNGLFLEHLQITEVALKSVNIEGGCTCFDLEIEAPTTTAIVAHFGAGVATLGHPRVYGLYISLSTDAATPDPTTLVQWDVPRGILSGVRVDVGASSYTNFMDGVVKLADPQDVNFTQEQVFGQAVVNKMALNNPPQLPGLFSGEFDGIDSAVALSNLPATDGAGATGLNTNYTWEWWMRSDADGEVVAGKVGDSGYLAYVQNATVLYHKSEVSPSGYLSIALPQSCRGMHHYMITRNGDGDTFAVYQDGVACSLGYFGDPTPVRGERWDTIGTNGAGAFPFTGAIHSMRAWGRTLTAAEALDACRGRYIDDTYLGLDMQFSEGSGTNVADLSLNSIVGTASGGFSWSTREEPRRDGLALVELSADPPNPPEGDTVIWQSDGTGSGDDGDIMMKITSGGSTKTVTLVDFSAA